MGTNLQFPLCPQVLIDTNLHFLPCPLALMDTNLQFPLCPQAWIDTNLQFPLCPLALMDTNLQLLLCTVEAPVEALFAMVVASLRAQLWRTLASPRARVGTRDGSLHNAWMMVGSTIRRVSNYRQA